MPARENLLIQTPPGVLNGDLEAEFLIGLRSFNKLAQDSRVCDALLYLLEANEAWHPGKGVVQVG